MANYQSKNKSNNNPAPSIHRNWYNPHAHLIRLTLREIICFHNPAEECIKIPPNHNDCCVAKKH
jgi:hypothetical protein